MEVEFSQKLQQLRKQRGLTQEELAERLYVSRTAVSKWESGRGLPSIDSLKVISKVLGVTIDELLSGEEIIQAAEDDKKKNAIILRTFLFGLFDIMCFVFFFVPLFGQQNGDFVESVSLLAMKSLPGYLFFPYIAIFSITVVFGVVEIALWNCQNAFWVNNSGYLSMALTIAATVLFIMSRQPYIAFFELWLLIIKGALYIKQH